MNLVRITQQASILASIISTSLLIHIDLVSAQQRACILTDEGSIICGKLTTQIKKPSQSSGYRKEVDKFVFVLKGCKRSDISVKCDFTITNIEKDRYITVWVQGSKIIDLSGKPHNAFQLELDGRNDTLRADPKLVKDVDYAASLTFKDIPDQIIKSQLLYIGLGSGGSVQFRNVSISN